VSSAEHPALVAHQQNPVGARDREIAVQVGERVTQDGFCFADLLPMGQQAGNAP